MVIKHLDAEHLKDAIKLKIECWSEELSGKAENTLDFNKEYAFWLKWLSSGKQNDDERLGLGIFKGATFLGCAFASFAEPFDIAEEGIELNGLWIKPEYRGRGLSMMLLKALCKHYEAFGIKEMVIYNVHGSKSNDFYIHLGAERLRHEKQMDGVLPIDVFKLLLLNIINHQSRPKILEISKEEGSEIALEYVYETDRYYEVVRKSGLFSITLDLKPLPSPLVKRFSGKLFEPYLECPIAFGLIYEGETIGYMQLNHEQWSNRLRICELLLEAPYRKKGMGSLLLQKAIEVGRKRACRSVVLETQSCNFNAIAAYIKNGFDVIGIDLSCYSNTDLEKKEVRLEMGLYL